MAHGQAIPYAQSYEDATNNTLGLTAKSPLRSIITLNGTWQYRADEDGSWASIRVPSSIQGEGRYTFQRDFFIDAQQLQHSVFQLVAVSISYYCEIRINGQFIGKHAGETSFGFKLQPGVLKSGRNSITIDINNFLNAAETVPVYERLWNRRNAGGIIHDIALIATGPVWVQETEIFPSVSGDNKPVTISYKALLNSGALSKDSDSLGVPRISGRIDVEHYFEVFENTTGQLVARSESKHVAVESDRLIPVELTLYINSVRVWSPESPYLYSIRQKTLRNGVLIDEAISQIGFRDFRVSNNSLRLNGAPYFIKAVTYMEDSPKTGRSLTPDEMERDILLMKNLGVNAVRTFSSVHPLFLSLCSKYGLLVLLDIPVVGVPSSILSADGLQSTTKNVLRETLARDINSPCVVAIGLASAIDGKTTGYESFIQSVTTGLQNHTNQLVYVSFARPPSSLPDRLDFIGIDIPPFPKVATPQLFAALSLPNYSIPVLISSLSYPVEVGNYNGYSDPRSIDAQGQFFLDRYNTLTENDFAGLVIHSFADWGVNPPIMSVDRVYQFTSTTGIVDMYRYKRIGYDILKAKFNKEKAPVLTIGDYAEELPVSFVVIGIFLILVFAIVYNLFRRFRENVTRSLLRPFNFYADVRDQRMLSLFQTSVIGLVGSLSASLIIANFMYFWRTNYFFDIFIDTVVKSVWLKQWINYAAWNPLPNILVLTAALFLLLVIYTFILRAISFFMRKKILLFDAYSVAMWSVLPMIFLAPFGMVLHRLLNIPLFEGILFAAFLMFNIWVLSRLLKGTSIVLDVRPGYFYVLGYGLFLIGCAVWLVTMDNRYETFDYLHYHFNIWSFLTSIPS